ncbi:hypothetical protein MD588_07015 [Photobacterium sp. SDRW27]|uniref:hypothetical protein n=1 Tax=Photobacterium obscurum TaxID=2829490 RepID=UPI002243FE9F|nr:hypothetical protein [Photobacterium obscurum]MCW8328555.1 hypothetical protein [Photobacterium obscurum]
MFKLKIIVPFFALLLSGCVGLNTVSLTPVPAQRDHQITATSSSWNFIGINFDNAFVDEAVENLKSQCPTGKIEGVYTKHQTTAYALIFKREIVATAYCNEA